MKQRFELDDDDDLDERGVLKDGRRISVRTMMLDGKPLAPRAQLIADASFVAGVSICDTGQSPEALRRQAIEIYLGADIVTKDRTQNFVDSAYRTKLGDAPEESRATLLAQAKLIAGKVITGETDLAIKRAAVQAFLGESMAGKTDTFIAAAFKHAVSHKAGVEIDAGEDAAAAVAAEEAKAIEAEKTTKDGVDARHAARDEMKRDLSKAWQTSEQRDAEAISAAREGESPRDGMKRAMGNAWRTPNAA